MKDSHPQRVFKDSWRPEDKALESAEEEVLERQDPEKIAQERADRHRHTPAMKGFEKSPQLRPPAGKGTLRGRCPERFSESRKSRESSSRR